MSTDWPQESELRAMPLRQRLEHARRAALVEDKESIDLALDRIAELENALTAAARHLEDVYGPMPTDRSPGPPTSIIETMRAVALRNEK